MALKSMIMEFGMGADILGGDYTKAAVRAVENALRRNGIRFADALGMSKHDFLVKVTIGVTRPDLVDRDRVAAVLPYGQREVAVEEGGLDIPLENVDGNTVMANAVLTVFLDVPDTAGEAR